jgi:hypothetical protein
MSHDDSSPNQTTPQDSLVDVNVPQPEKTPTIPLEPEQEHSHPEPQNTKNNPVVETVTLQTHFSKPDTDSADTFKEEQTIKPSEPDLPQNENKPLQELKNLIQQALNNHEFSAPPPVKEDKPPTTTTTVAAAPENATPAEQPMVDEEVATNKEEAEVKETVQVASVDDDGAKTVEAIEQSVVAVSSSVPAPQEPVAEKDESKDDFIDVNTTTAPRNKVVVNDVASNSYTFENLNGQNYRYRVRAYIDKAASDWSDYMSVLLSSGMRFVMNDDKYAPMQYYMLNGQRVTSINHSGLYIVKQGNRKVKLIKK